MTPDHTKQCNHIDLLLNTPSKEELSVLRKGLRKMKLPEICNGFKGSNDQLGSFVAISEKDNSVSFEWNIFGRDKKTVLFDDLCHKPELELDRLELGWLIMNLHALDRMHEVKAIADPNETMRVISWFSKREEQWKRWALVPAGHMIF